MAEKSSTIAINELAMDAAVEAVKATPTGRTVQARVPLTELRYLLNVAVTAYLEAQ